jgi:cellulose synthase/poly-beta-1,6-N-acetylglucosamine synthase-like glycosyltransferase
MMGEIVTSFALMLAGAYFIVLLWLLLGLFRIKRDTRQQGYKPLFVSVIVAARNEEENLAGCLKSLLRQSYPRDLYEVILVDDDSNDSTLSIARPLANRDKRLKLLNTKKHYDLTGKQHALDVGIRASKGEIILNTDADCEAPPIWIEDTIREFEPGVGLVAGFSLLDEKCVPHKGVFQKIFIKLQLLESLSLYIGSIGSMAQGVAWACTGNNLAYRREIYDELGGFEALGTTGAEDSMLLQWVDMNSKWKVKPVLNVVYVKPMRTVSQFFAQRFRWASSSLQNRLSLTSLYVIVYILNLLLPFLAGFCAFGVISCRELTVFLSLKIVPEFMVILKGLTLFDRIDLIRYFPLILPFHLIYVLICGIYGLSGKFAWKGRKYGEGTIKDI